MLACKDVSLRGGFLMFRSVVSPSCVWVNSLKGVDVRKHKVCYGHPMRLSHPRTLEHSKVHASSNSAFEILCTDLSWVSIYYAPSQN
jgi:hypothetical protein